MIYLLNKNWQIPNPSPLRSYVQWKTFFVFADVEKTSTEAEWKFLWRLFLTCSARLV